MDTTSQQTALITGASSGIGLELARLFARDGLALVLVARNQARLAALAQDPHAAHGVAVSVVRADLSRPGAAAEIVAQLQAQAVTVDVLVNNAGTQVYGLFGEVEAEALTDLLQVNIATLVQLTHRLLPGMVQRRRGKILNLGSTGSYVPGPLNAVYCASKAFVLSFSEALAAELDGTGVTVTALCPGATRTEFAERHGLQDVRLFQNAMPAAQVAAIGYRALQRGRRTVIAGGANQLQILSFQLLGPFMGLVSNRQLMQLGRYFMGRVSGG